LLYLAKGRQNMAKKIRSYAMVKSSLIILGTVVVLLVGMGRDLQAATPEDSENVPSAKKSRYLCEDGKNFTLEVNTQDDCVILTLDGKPTKLPRVVSGSGSRYSNGRTTVWLKGNEAIIEMDGKIIIKNCRSQD
jgi:membrane-bound inhibitor of C-type lysozyme